MDLIINFLHHLASFVVVLTVIVFVHEFGHYAIARLCGVKITAFSIGFGRELWGFNDRTGTHWRISALPLGGFVKMHGDSSAASTADLDALDAMPEEEKRVTFHFKPLWQKAAIVAAGPFSNFLLTITVLTYFILTVGLPSAEPVIGEIMKDTAAEAAGLKAGDRILSVNGKKVAVFNDIPYFISTNLGTPIDLVIERSGTQSGIVLTPRNFEEEDALGNKVSRPLIGIRSKDIKYEEVGPFRAVGEATYRTYLICETTLRVLAQMVTGERSAKDLKGPVGIAKLSGQATGKGFSTTLWLIAMLSANLGLVNLLPIPMLDGGHLAYYAAHAARGRPLAQKVQEYGFRLGFATIATLMAFTIYNDLRQLF